MTTRSAVILKIEEKGDTEECSGPGRTVYSLEGLGCTTDSFFDWYHVMPEFEEFAYCPPNLLIDLGGTKTTFQVGQVLSVTFEEHFDHWLTLVRSSLK